MTEVYDAFGLPEDLRTPAMRDAVAAELARGALPRMDDLLVVGNRVLLMQEGQLAGEFCVEGLLNLGGRQ